jgi:hypothetical protein
VIDPKKIDAEPDPILRGSVTPHTLNRFYSSLPRELDAERVTRRTLDAAVQLIHRCLDDALESGVRLDLTDLQAAELRHTLRSDLEGFLRDEAASEVQFVPDGSRLRSARNERLPSCSADFPHRRPLALREDRPDRRRPVQCARHRAGLQVGKGRALGSRHRP